MVKNSDKLLKVYIIILFYSSILKMFFGRWATLIADMALIGLIVYYVACTGGKLKIKKAQEKYFWVIFLIQVISIAEIFHTNINNRLYSIIEYRKSYFQMLILLVFLLYLDQTNLDISKWLKYIGYLGMPIVLYGIKQFLFWGKIDDIFAGMNDADFWTLHYGGHVRSISIFSGPFQYGMFCILIFAIFFYLFLEERKKRYFCLSLFAAFGCYCSITRTNLVCLIVAAIIFLGEFYIHDYRKNAITIKMMFIVLAALVIGLAIIGVIPILSGDNMLGRMLGSILNSTSDTRFTQRFITWKDAITYIVANPIWGWGMGSAGDTLSKYNISNVYVTSHSMYLKVIMETGIIGGLLYIILPVWTLFATRRKLDYRLRGLSYSIIACVLINGMVGSTISTFPSITLFWILLALIIAKEYSNENAK